MRNVPRAPDIDTTSRPSRIFFRLCRSGQLVEREIELQDIDARVADEAKRPADGVPADELVNGIEADTARLGDSGCLQVRIGHRYVGVEAARTRCHRVCGHRVAGAFAGPVDDDDLADAVVDTEGRAGNGHTVVGGDERLRGAFLVDRYHTLDRAGHPCVVNDGEHRTDTAARAVRTLPVDA